MGPTKRVSAAASSARENGTSQVRTVSPSASPVVVAAPKTHRRDVFLGRVEHRLRELRRVAET